MCDQVPEPDPAGCRDSCGNSSGNEQRAIAAARQGAGRRRDVLLSADGHQYLSELRFDYHLTEPPKLPPWS